MCALNDDSNLLVRSQSVERNGWEDWALLELDKCFGAKPYDYGYLKLAPVTTREIMKGGANLRRALDRPARRQERQEPVGGSDLPPDRPDLRLRLAA
jgi:hypothetical protein